MLDKRFNRRYHITKGERPSTYTNIYSSIYKYTDIYRYTKYNIYNTIRGNIYG